ncbi:LysR family transcriptional regulator [Streptomyces mirabilis]|uniref:LysR family transcriptional regulator n=1 Tax=Streptomyces mirabilis TaxID=68239 RepID=UPI003658AE51
MRLPSLDLNLVVVLHALLDERNVTHAGERVGLSQPATSAALARLRRHFDDPLLERVGTTYELTPLAHALQGQLGSTLEQLQDVLAAHPRFEAATAERKFVIACSDSVLAVLGPSIVGAVARVAPRVTLDFQPANRRVVTEPLALLSEVDLLIAPRGLFSLPDAPAVELYHDRWICAAWSDNTSVGDRLTFEQAAQARWVMPFHSLLMASTADAALAALGIDRRCAVEAQSFALLDRLVVGTELLVLTHGRFAGDLAERGLREVMLPVELPPFVELAWSHPSRQLDPAHRWLVDVVTSQARCVDQAADE